MTAPFRHRFRVRYAELDPQGVVFNARYLKYADLIVTEYWRACELRLTGEDALEFHVAHADIDFRKPIRAEEEIEGRAWTTRIGTSSMVTRIELHGVGANGPETNGPEANGPETNGPESGSPESSGPESSGPESSGPEDDLRAEIELVNVHVSLASGQPLPIPDTARSALAG